MVSFSLKSLIYKQLQPMSKACGCQLLLMDSKTYQTYYHTIEKKMRTLGIDQDQYDELKYAIEDYGCIAILKSTKYISSIQIAPYFANVGLKSSEIHRLNSVEAKKHPDFGDIDSTIPAHKRKFLYWFAVVVEDVEGTVVMEDVNKETDRYSSVDPVEWHGIRGFITVKDFLDAIDSVPAKHVNAFVNFAPESDGVGKIYGQVNDVFVDREKDGTYCIFTLAPYKNGSRSQDCSINGNKNSPLKLSEIKDILEGIPPSSVIQVRYTDPLAFGLKSGQIVETPLDSIDLDNVMGIFARPKNDITPKVVVPSPMMRESYKRLR